jgi:hypothetical protein
MNDLYSIHSMMVKQENRNQIQHRRLVEQMMNVIKLVLENFHQELEQNELV